MRVEQEALPLSAAAIPPVGTHTLSPGLRRISPPPCSNQEGSLRRPLPGGSPLTPQAFWCARKSVGPGTPGLAVRVGFFLQAHRSQPIPSHGSVLLNRHLELG